MTLRKLTTAAVFSPCRSAASSIDDGKGLIDSTRRSAASASPACCETAERTRSVKNVTALIAATATTSAANKTSTSPDFQSRANRRPASRHGVLITDPLLLSAWITGRLTRYWADSRAANGFSCCVSRRFRKNRHASDDGQRRQLLAATALEPENGAAAQLSVSQLVRLRARRHCRAR